MGVGVWGFIVRVSIDVFRLGWVGCGKSLEIWFFARRRVNVHYAASEVHEMVVEDQR